MKLGKRGRGATLERAVAKQPRTRERSRSNPGQESGREATQDKRVVAKQPRTKEWSRSNPGQVGREATQDKRVVAKQPRTREWSRSNPGQECFVLTDYKSQSRTMGRVLLGFYGRTGDDKCDIIGMYVELSRCEALPVPTLKSEGFPGVTDAPLPDSRNRTPQKDIGQNGGGIRRKACCMKS
ncbi:hypothetical protein V8E54_007551 [Elaphomyces granulatus]